MKVWELFCEAKDRYINNEIKNYRAETEEELARKFEKSFYSMTFIVFFYVCIIVMATIGIIGATIIEVVRALVG